MIHDLDKPSHIERVDNESRNTFSRLRGEETTMEKIFQQTFKNINMDLAWDTFDKICYDEMFRETAGDTELIYDPYVRSRTLQKVYRRWPLRYYCLLLRNNGIMDSVETPEGEVFFFKEGYKDSIKSLLTVSETR